MGLLIAYKQYGKTIPTQPVWSGNKVISGKYPARHNNAIDTIPRRPRDGQRWCNPTRCHRRFVLTDRRLIHSDQILIECLWSRCKYPAIIFYLIRVIWACSHWSISDNKSTFSPTRINKTSKGVPTVLYYRWSDYFDSNIGFTLRRVAV